MQYWLVMPAAGSGRRFGGGVPKQYLPLAGATVIEHALAPFMADARCTGIVVARDAADTAFASLPVAASPKLRLVDGGARRCDSVRNGLTALAITDATWVLVHDAARPCLPRADLDALLTELADHPVGGLLAAPLADTLKQSDVNQLVTGTPSREGLWRALTPQMFRLGLLREALDAAATSGREPTDEAQAVEWLGKASRLVAGSAANLKITTPADLAVAEALLTRGGGA